MSSNQLWLADALRDPALAGAASVLLHAMTVTGGGSGVGGGSPSSSPPQSAAVAEISHHPPLAPAPVLSISEASSAGAAAARGATTTEAGGTPVLLADGGGPPSPAPSLPTSTSDRGWVARSACSSSSRRKRDASPPPSGGDHHGLPEQRSNKRGRVVVKVVPDAFSTKASQSNHKENSLQDFFSSLLSSRGYSTTTLRAAQCGYRLRPTPLQRASYGTAVLAAVRRTDAVAFRSLLSSGLSPNPCSGFSEDVLHMTCKRGLDTLVRAQLDAGADVRIADDLGRTPLHHAAWAGHLANFNVVEMLLDRDPNLLRVADDGGKTPLDFVRAPQDREEWKAFLTSRADRYWPPRTHDKGAQAPDNAGPPVVDRPDGALQDPEGALPIDLAKLVASGGMSIEKVASMRSSLAVGAGPIVVSTPLGSATGRRLSASFATEGEETQDADYFNGARVVVNRMA